MIEDDELRELFGSECEEHLQTLAESLLQLEKTPRDQALLEAVFRASHSLKGSARMVGASAIESVAHALEENLSEAKRGYIVLSPADIDRLGKALDALQKLVDEAVRATPAQVNVTQILTQLAARGTARETPYQNFAENSPFQSFQNVAPPTSSTRPSSTRFADLNPLSLRPLSAPEAVFNSPVQESQAPEIAAPVSSAPMSSTLALRENAADALSNSTDASDFKIQTMRVPPARLDALMTLARELTVTTARVTRGLSALDEINDLCDIWSRDLARRKRYTTALNATALKSDDAVLARALLTAQHDEESRLAQLRSLWLSFKSAVPKNAARLGIVAEDMEASVRNIRLLPLSTIFGLFPRSVRDLARAQDKEVQLTVEGGETAVDKRVLEELKDPLMHMMRNAIDHGIEAPQERERSGKARAATLRLRAQGTATGILIELSDDGRGLDIAAIRQTARQRALHSAEELAAMSDEQAQMLIFAAGFSTRSAITDVSGRGVGMDVVRHNVETLKGTISVESVAGRGCTFSIRLPLTLATTRVLLVRVGEQTFALPIEFVCTILQVESSQIFQAGSRPTTMLGDEAISLTKLADLLAVTPMARTPISSTRNDDKTIYVVLEIGGDRVGVAVDALLDEQEVVFKTLGTLLKRVRNVAGTTILGSGEVCLVLNAHDLLRSAARHTLTPARHVTENSPPQIESPENRARGKTVLLVEDSITTRMHEKRILESAGYEVVTAVDGADGLSKLAVRAFDVVVSDIQMPNLDGLAMTAKIREDKRLGEMPVILVTSLSSDDDKRRGVEVGANAYLAKGTFEQVELLETLQRLVG